MSTFNNEPNNGDIDPFFKLTNLLQIIENKARGSVLLAVYLGQCSDDNSVSRILLFFNKLMDQQATPARLKRNITQLVDAGLIDREQEKMLGTVKVSFHQLLPLGEISLVYFLFHYLINDPFDSFNIDQEKFKELLRAEDIRKLILKLVNLALQDNKSLKKYFISAKETKNIEKMKFNPIEVETSSILSSKTGKNFKIFESLLEDYLDLSMGLTSQELENKALKITKTIENSLEYLVCADKIGKSNYYRLDRKGIAMLPLLLLMMRQLAEEPELFFTKKDFLFCPREFENSWIVLVKNSKKILKKIYS